MINEPIKIKDLDKYRVVWMGIAMIWIVVRLLSHQLKFTQVVGNIFAI